MSDFRSTVDALLVKLCAAKTVDEVMVICAKEPEISAGEGFWIADGDAMLGALYNAGWQCVEYRAVYHWCLRAPDGSLLTYTEGDLDRGNNLPRENA